MKINPQLTGCYKFVRVKGEYRFCSLEDEHKSLVQGWEEAESAGTIAVFDEFWRFGAFNYSTSLRMGTDSLDQEKLTDIIGKVYIEMEF